VNWIALIKNYQKNAQQDTSKPPSLLDDYIVIDLETTGLSPITDEIIQISAMRFRNHREYNSYSTYVKPSCRIPRKITELTGIDDFMVSKAPTYDQAADSFFDFLSTSPMLTGYNVNFDLRFLSAAAGFEITEKYKFFDTLPLARRHILYLPDYKLCDVCSHIGFSTQFHDALNDCRACGAVLKYINEINSSEVVICYCKPSNETGSSNPRWSCLKSYNKKQSDCGCPIDIEQVSTDGPLCGKNIVFTGMLSFGRAAAENLAQQAGAQIKTSVSRKTNFLVVGEQDCSLVGDDGMSTKEERAYQLINECGVDIKIIDEATFLKLICCKEGAASGTA